MNVKQCLIVDLEQQDERRRFVTESVESIAKNAKGLWSVRFAASQRIFNYNPSRLLYLTNPEIIDIEEKGLYINNKHISGVKELLCFTDNNHRFYHVTYNNGYHENLEGKKVYVTRTPIDKNGGSTWQYLNKLAAETGLTTQENLNILSKQYELVDTKRDNVPLAQYLGDPTPLKERRQPKQIYYPFGCNASQKSAVERALTHQLSIIQGPPGTGKTQTILNIIANLLMNNKTVLVVSNNNSAVENVAEKLTSEGLGFIVAQLGSAQNKKTFIENQSDYPDMDEWKLQEPSSVKETAEEALQKVAQGFEAQIRQAELKAEYDALQKEAEYNSLIDKDSSHKMKLTNKSSVKLLQLLHLFQRKIENGQKPNILFRIRWAYTLGIKIFNFLKRNPANVISELEDAYYQARATELSHEMQSVTTTLHDMDIEKNVTTLRASSLQVLKHTIAHRYKGNERKVFKIHDIKNHSEDFLHEYPVVLSTTYSAKNCINKDMVFDYVIMDEASQVDVKTGALALSCAMNAVIVGDDKQLPNVISSEEAQALNAIQSTYQVDDRYNAAANSFLQSCLKVFPEAPSTLLREHYRCHPRIIEFCNQRFYNNELLTMTNDSDEAQVLQVVRTVPGNHARGHFNQREIDVIEQEILPEYKKFGTIGIITPYHLQAEEINKSTGQDLASTVHKYQGRECDTIIMSMVDNQPTTFSDDPNLLNVAISRAKKHLCVVTNGNEMNPDSILAQLIAYVQYNNFEIKESKLHSVFDLLYKQYTAQRLEYESTHPQISEYLSENLIYNLLLKAIEHLQMTNTGIICHYPLSRLITDWEPLDSREKDFTENPLSHIDFLIYNTLTKRPIMAVEVDGWHFHQDSEVQQSRDALKDHILKKIGLPLQRISTTDTVNEEYIMQLIRKG